MLEHAKQELKKFVDTTSIKGIKRTIMAQSWTIRIFWIMALLVCCGMLLFQVITVVMYYCSYPALKNSADVHTEPNFPHITVCNLFPAIDTKNYPAAFERYLQRLESVEKQAPSFFVNKGIWNFLKALWSFNVNNDILSELHGNSTALQDLIAECIEYGWDLYGSNKCTQFLSAIRPLQLCKTITPRSNRGAVKLILYIDNFFPQPIKNYFSFIRSPISSGVKIIVHPPEKKPDPNNAVYAAPGTDVTIEVVQNNITRLPKPHGNCVHRQSDSSDKDVNDSFLYSQAACISLCRQRQYIEACGCLDPFEYFTMKDLDSGKKNFCQNITYYLEQTPEYIHEGLLPKEFWNRLNCTMYFLPNEDKCDCPIQCFEVRYDLTSSVAQWPNIYYQLAFYENWIRKNEQHRQKFLPYETVLNNSFNQSGEETLRQLEALKLIERNFIQVTVKMKQKSVELITYIEAMRWDTLTSNLGGALNLWMGVSILTAVEIIELVYSLLKVILERKRAEAPVRPEGEKIDL